VHIHKEQRVVNTHTHTQKAVGSHFFFAVAYTISLIVVYMFDVHWYIFTVALFISLFYIF